MSQTLALDDISAQFDGVLTAFTLAASAVPVSPRAVHSLLVVYDGIVQIPGSGFTLAGSTITFTFTPQIGDDCSIVVING